MNSYNNVHRFAAIRLFDMYPSQGMEDVKNGNFKEVDIDEL